MITLKTPKATIWDRNAPADSPRLIVIDKARVRPVRHDPDCSHIEFGIQFGCVDQNGAFIVHTEANGSTSYEVHSLTDSDPRNPEAKAYSGFLADVAAKGAKHGDFREGDIEEWIVSQGILDGVVDK